MTSSMCFSTPAQSTSPSAVNGVTSATSTWPKGFLGVDTLQGYRGSLLDDAQVSRHLLTATSELVSKSSPAIEAA
jgi:hypothetical protein